MQDDGFADLGYFFTLTNLELLTFSDGGTLTNTDSYRLSLSRYQMCSFSRRATWSYTWTYLVAPAGDGSVASRTAWRLMDVRNDPGQVPVPIDATLASESAMSNEQGQQPWHRKYSFALLDSAGLSRITDLKVTLTNTDKNGVAPIVQPATHMIRTDLVFPQDNFWYSGNAGENGYASLLTPSANVSEILDGAVPGYDDVADDFANNNSDVGFTTTVHKAVMDSVTFNLEPGCYSATISAKVKGVAGNLDLPIAVTKKAGISAENYASPVITGCITP